MITSCLEGRCFYTFFVSLHDDRLGGGEEWVILDSSPWLHVKRFAKKFCIMKELRHSAQSLKCWSCQTKPSFYRFNLSLSHFTL